MSDNVTLPYPYRSYAYSAELSGDTYYTSFVKDFNPSPELKKKSISVRLSGASEPSHVVFYDNPIITDVTQTEQTDLKYLFSQNPDINGLALSLDDQARSEELSTVSYEDFMPASDHYDVFDLMNFIDSAKNQFRKLPAEFRLKFNNNPINLIKALDDNSTKTAVVADLARFLGPLDVASDNSGIPSVDRDNVSPASSSNQPAHDVSDAASMKTQDSKTNT